MINSDFASNYEIKRYELDSLIRDKYKILSSFEPYTPSCNHQVLP